MKKAVLLILTILILISSCNLDSGQGVFQQAFNASKKNYEMIQTVLGTAGDKIILYANRDVYEFDGTKMTKIAEVSNELYFPIFVEEDRFYFAYKNTEAFRTRYFPESDAEADGYFRFFQVSESQLSATEGITDTTLIENQEVTISGADNITAFSVTIQDLEHIQVLFSLAGDNEDKSDPNEYTTNYGIIDRNSISASSFTISNIDNNIPATAGIIGLYGLRVFQDDSEMADGQAYLKDRNSFFYKNSPSESFTEIDCNWRRPNTVDTDEVIMGYDGEYVIDLQGYVYRLDPSADRKRVRISSVNAPDLIYRRNNLMMVYEDSYAGSDFKMGYLYEEGIYINDSAQENPYILRISDDNDLLTAGWIGDNGNGKYLFATQENGFWIIELGEKDSNNRFKGSIHQYQEKNRFGETQDGPLSDYLH